MVAVEPRGVPLSNQSLPLRYDVILEGMTMLENVTVGEMIEFFEDEAIWVGWWCEQHHTLRRERTSWWSCRWIPVAMIRLDGE